MKTELCTNWIVSSRKSTSEKPTNDWGSVASQREVRPKPASRKLAGLLTESLSALNSQDALPGRNRHNQDCREKVILSGRLKGGPTNRLQSSTLLRSQESLVGFQFIPSLFNGGSWVRHSHNRDRHHRSACAIQKYFPSFMSDTAKALAPFT